jgi:cytochrome c oxidase assembly protein subunit 11
VAEASAQRRWRKRATLVGIFGALAVMFTLVSYSVTLYRLFCQVTGAGGYTGRVPADTAVQSNRMVTVAFDTNVAPGFPWRFQPVQRQVRVHLGEDTLVFFEAENLADKPLVGHATFNVTPEKIGAYFKKIQCFCFTEERLEPHQKVEMPVDFFVDPRLASDADTTDVNTITLSYTFFQSLEPQGAQELGRFDKEKPSAAAGQELFATVCSACHELDQNKVGPPLRGVVGRPAGSVPGYPYSTALARAHITWDAATLDQWLADPGRFVPGATMPLSIPDEVRRRDIIAYLESLRPPASGGRS